jgi:hypothetical protein
MNRLRISGYPLSLVLLLVSPAMAQTSPPPGWETIKAGVQVLKLWKTTGPTLPQIAIFQLSSEAYKEFRRDPEAFVDGPLIFGERVRPKPHLTQLLSVSEGYSDGWTVTCFHRVSLMRCASYPVEPQYPEKRRKK